jgi:uncharacterized protein
MQQMGWLYSEGRAPAEVMASMAAEDRKRGAYAPCTCGSGRKFRFCHGAREVPSNVMKPSTAETVEHERDGRTVYRGRTY